MALNGVVEVWIGIEDPAQGEMVQPTMETYSCSSVTGPRDGGPMTQECPTPVSTLNHPGEN